MKTFWKKKKTSGEEVLQTDQTRHRAWVKHKFKNLELNRVTYRINLASGEWFCTIFSDEIIKKGDIRSIRRAEDILLDIINKTVIWKIPEKDFENILTKSIVSYEVCKVEKFYKQILETTVHWINEKSEMMWTTMQFNDIEDIEIVDVNVESSGIRINSD